MCRKLIAGVGSLSLIRSLAVVQSIPLQGEYILEATTIMELVLTPH